MNFAQPLLKVTIRNKKTKLTAKINKADWDAKNAGDWELVSPSKTKAAAEPEPEDDSSEDDAPEEPKIPKEDWTKLTWPKARSYIKKVTGVFPKDKAEAAELMED